MEVNVETSLAFDDNDKITFVEKAGHTVDEITKNKATGHVTIKHSDNR